MVTFKQLVNRKINFLLVVELEVSNRETTQCWMLVEFSYFVCLKRKKKKRQNLTSGIDASHIQLTIIMLQTSIARE